MAVAWMSMLSVRHEHWWALLWLKFWSIDNYPVVRHRRPVMNPPNHWSHPFPRFSYENSQIRIRFYSDPALPSCSEYLYPDESWRNSQFVLTRNSEQIIHAHPLSDFQPWALRVPFSPPTHSSTLNSDIKWRIVVEPRFKNTSDEKTVRHFIRTPDEKTLWDIIPLRSWTRGPVGTFHASFLTSVNHWLLF